MLQKRQSLLSQRPSPGKNISKIFNVTSRTNKRYNITIYLKMYLQNLKTRRMNKRPESVDYSTLIVSPAKG